MKISKMIYKPTIHKKRGFTLIELLVVIAIIGILSSVVLASLRSARQKGADAAVKSNLANAGAQAELYYEDSGQGYEGVCTNGTNGIQKFFDAAMAAGGGQGLCQDDTDSWAASVELSSCWCVDSNGARRKIQSCPPFDLIVKSDDDSQLAAAALAQKFEKQKIKIQKIGTGPYSCPQP